MYDYGLTDEQFWNLTPPQYYALSERHDQANRHQDLRTGIVSSTIANCHRDAKERPEPFTAQDFMPSYGDEDEKERRSSKEMSGDQIMTRMLAAFPRMPAPEANGG